MLYYNSNKYTENKYVKPHVPVSPMHVVTNSAATREHVTAGATHAGIHRQNMTPGTCDSWGHSCRHSPPKHDTRNLWQLGPLMQAFTVKTWPQELVTAEATQAFTDKTWHQEHVTAGATQVFTAKTWHKEHVTAGATLAFTAKHDIRNMSQLEHTGTQQTRRYWYNVASITFQIYVVYWQKSVFNDI